MSKKEDFIFKKICDESHLIMNDSDYTESWNINENITDVQIKRGKPCDIFNLKLDNVKNFRNKVNFLKKSYSDIYENVSQNIFECPVCNNSTENFNKKEI